MGPLTQNQDRHRDGNGSVGVFHIWRPDNPPERLGMGQPSLCPGIVRPTPNQRHIVSPVSKLTHVLPERLDLEIECAADIHPGIRILRRGNHDLSYAVRLQAFLAQFGE